MELRLVDSERQSVSDQDIKAAQIASTEQMERERLMLEAERMRLDAEMQKYVADQQAQTAKMQNETAAKVAEKPAEPKEPKEKDDKDEKQPIVVNIQAPPAPNVTVEPPVVNVAAPVRKKGPRKATVKGSDGTSFTVESDD
jgi:outer membrane biosynthesis protein TonB